jgi:hypothetical protein
MGQTSHAIGTSIMVALDTFHAMCKRYVVALQNFPRQHLKAPIRDSRPISSFAGFIKGTRP